MTPQASSQSSFNPARSADDAVTDLEDKESKFRREATVYDAAAGRVSSAGFIPKAAIFSSTRDTPSSSATAAGPETVLFRRKNAPTRFAEHDIYFANERRPSLNLPDTDLLTALHAYTSDFYDRATPDRGLADWRSMDETALIALGILMEEVSSLDKTADLTFVEGEEISELRSNMVGGHTARASGRSKGPSSKKRRIDRLNIGIDE
ncbi:hypothetical protein BGZ60DRAFT_100348 [Tricladium varicosporioides]|nr:hypothetical protein BGZ60DRAFT_100348 [Hymenoscyphus varicosporioides]